MQDDKPVIFTIMLPADGDVPPGSRYAYWLKLADIALADAGEEFERMKQNTLPDVPPHARSSANKRRRRAA